MKLGLKDLFKDLTWMQVGAGALAAATSLFFASSIGIAGSIIGAAVGSIVTTVSSALYKSFLTASNDAIKEKIVGPSGNAENPTDTGIGGSTTRLPTCTDATRPLVVGSTEDVDQGARPFPYERTGARGTTAIPRTSARGPREAARVQELARLRKRARTEKRVAIVSLVTGLVAVLGCALVVYTATNGSGLGYRPEPVMVPVETPVTNDAPDVSDVVPPSLGILDGAASATDTSASNSGSTTVTAPVEPATPEPDAGTVGDSAATGSDVDPAEPPGPDDSAEPTSPEEPAAPQEPESPDAAGGAGEQEPAGTDGASITS